MLDVARDVAKLFDMPESKIVHVKDRAFNDQYATRPGLTLPTLQNTGIERSLSCRERTALLMVRQFIRFWSARTL